MSDDRFETDSPSTLQPHPAKGTSPGLLLLLSLVATAAIGWALWEQYFRVPFTPDTQVNLNSTGFHLSVSKLDARFTDADGDMVADPPTDASKLIDPPTLMFAYVPTDEPEKQKEAWTPFTAYLSKATGRPVEYVLFTSTKDQLKAILDGKWHVAGFNTGAVP